MPATINTNMNSLNAQRSLSSSQAALSTSMARLSSGLRVNSAKDDAAGMAIAERMSAQVRGMNVAIRNANDGISYAQVSEGALSKVSDSLQRMRELAVQSRNVTNTAKDQGSLQNEFGQLQAEMSRVLDGTTFNGTTVFTQTANLDFQVGAGTSSNDRVSITVTAALNADATLTGVTGQQALAPFAEMLRNVDSTVLYLPATSLRAAKVQIHSDAALAVLRLLGGIWGLLGVAGLLVPRWIRDAAYKAFAKRRFRFFGRVQACDLWPSEWRARMLP